MNRTTVMLPHELKTQALKRANMMGISLGQFIREALSMSLESLQNDQSIHDTLFADDAVYHGKSPVDLAKNHDDYLYGE